MLKSVIDSPDRTNHLLCSSAQFTFTNSFVPILTVPILIVIRKQPGKNLYIIYSGILPTQVDFTLSSVYECKKQKCVKQNYKL